MRYADRMNQLGTETAFEVLAKARALEAQGRSILHLEIGEPDFDTPAPIRAAAARALDEGFTHYGPSAGLPEVREAIAAFISKDRGLKVSPDQVVVTPGGKPVLTFAIMACVNPGDEVVVPDPGFPIYESVVRFVGATPKPLVLREDRGFRFGAADLEPLLTPKTRMVVLNSPHNPTGSVLTPNDLDEIAALLREREIFVLSDEIYSKILYDGVHESIATRPGMAEKTILLDGFSKTYAMTGWRLGYGVMNPTLAKHVARLATNVYSCATSFVQRAAITALGGAQDEVRAMVAEFHVRRDEIVEGLNAIPGIRCLKPAGAFYVFPNIQALHMKSADAERVLLEEAGVAVLSGTAFGPRGEGYIRLSYANSIGNIREALRRIGATVSSQVRAAR
ncbi:MAG TPA: pyridoxal phosphate-dependent aminotransferase [Candidatus Limnocylindrales bacterium]|nr:pyridoxal phosphate-dependent aminotransferase [Candidatus Limnocylindrales bacterium]